MTITDKQKRHLKGLAHHLKPVVIVGQHGLSASVLSEIDGALEAHELIKVRVNAGDRDERKAMIDTICTESESELVQAIGHIAAFYRRHPKKPKIALPY
ncbi:MAG: ribosome assembly RNA-binding protein YhbY [Sedimenticola sp.]|nr:MAG: ribosome assembly RNA-binding protein YhbY [Sedimenticola sp.]